MKEVIYLVIQCWAEYSMFASPKIETQLRVNLLYD